MSSRTRIALITIIGLVTVVLAVVFATRFGADPRLSPSPLIGHPAPDVSISLVEGDDTLAIADLAGDVVVVNFWAPWCVPCRDEHPALLAISRDYADFGVSVIGITYQSTEPAVIDYLDELGRGYPVGMDDRSRAAIEFGVRGVPETFFIDRDGIVVAKIAGPITLELATATLDRIILGIAPEGTDA
jgi:cytochrome c biogenesis protein CcmG/thiol:disulfide interchange protein DsbE